MRLTLPDIRQKRDYDCGDAATWCVASFHGLARRPSLSVPTDGVDPRIIEQWFRCELLWNVSSGEMSVHDLRHYCDTNRPVITLVTQNGVGHYVVVSWVSHGRVHYHNPSFGPMAMRLPEWEKMWNDVGRMGEAFRRWSIVAWPDN